MKFGDYVFFGVGALQVLLVVLRVSGHIGCSWWLVLAPLWVTAGLLVAVVSYAVMEMEDERAGRGRSVD